MSKKITISIVGATGYTGLELLRLLKGHGRVTIKYLISQSSAGQHISTIWPHLSGVYDDILSNASIEKMAKESDCVFLALPHFESQKIASKILGKTVIIDLSSDFRIKNLSKYKKFYGTEHSFPEGLKEFAYGMPEINKTIVAKSHNIANPGCFATASILSLHPLKKILKHANVFAITGSSGSGKDAKEGTHHPIRNHDLKSYKIGTHQHLAEITETLGIDASEISFVPTSGPFTRGILATSFIDLKNKASVTEIKRLFVKTYSDQPFVRIKDNVCLAEVVGSNFCDISINAAGGKIVIQAAIDNLIKGAAGTAIQNFNLMMGLKETEGLELFSPLFP